MASYKDLTQEDLHKAFTYDSASGKLYWRYRDISSFKTTGAGKSWNSRLSGEEAGTFHISKRSVSKYRLVRIHTCMTLVHLIVWCMHYGSWPLKSIDHIDRDGTNNRVENLQEASQEEQGRNKGKSKNNTSGVKGVSWCKAKSKWRCRINIDKKEVTLGFFKLFDDAVNIRLNAEVANGYSPQGEL